jgi:diadenosine tetraphosphate (Ap4A) HIT family hydrolase
VIVRTRAWDLAHAYDTSLDGWMVLGLRRHVTALADLTDAEAAELGPLIQRTSAALRQVLGCPKTYVVQFAEHRLHPHVHVHVIARPADLPDEEQGPRVFTRLGVAEDKRVSEKRMDEIAVALHDHLADLDTGR